MEKGNLLKRTLHFRPTDKELLLLLKRRIELGVGEASEFIVEKNIYGINTEPWKIFNQNDPWEEDHVSESNQNRIKKYIYVFTQLKKLGPKKISRTAGEGTWGGQTKAEPIILRNRNMGDVCIGTKRLLTFQLKKNQKSKTRTEEEIQEECRNGHWNMYEYSLTNSEDDFVICKIIRSKFEEVVEDEEDEIDEEFFRPSKKLKLKDPAIEEEEVGTIVDIGFDDVIEVEKEEEVGETSKVINFQELASIPADIPTEVSTGISDFEKIGATTEDPYYFSSSTDEVLNSNLNSSNFNYELSEEEINNLIQSF